jgi:hypothetical protein
VPIEKADAPVTRHSMSKPKLPLSFWGNCSSNSNTEGGLATLDVLIS